MKAIIQKKQDEVVVVSEKMQASKAIIAFKYQGLTVERFQNLRKSMRENGCEICVIKNNISARAAKACGYDELSSAFSGPVALAFSKDDVVAPAKVLFDATKEENAKVEVLTGIVDGELYSFEQLQTLSQLPSYETLLTQLAAGMLGTVRQLAVGLNMLVEKGQEA